MRLFLAIRVFFAVLFSRAAVERVRQALEPAAAPVASATKPVAAKEKAPAKPPAPVRSEAITLLATLQREARLVDFIQEPLGGYSDAQIGAAARQVHRDCGQVLARLFELQPLRADAEGAVVEVPPGFDAGQIRLTGNVAGQPPYSGRLVHHGWVATKCQLPAWSGSEASSRVVAPAEVELP